MSDGFHMVMSTAPASGDTMAEQERLLSSVRYRIGQADGRRDGLAEREKELRREVGLAKGRLEERERIAEFLDTLLLKTHERSVGSFEKLLTSLVSDVLPESGTIGLDLGTERGLPSLDIYASMDGENRMDILNGKGGALTNVVSYGLRAIATVKSGSRNFMALDEPDCWIRPSNIPSFMRVIDLLAKRIHTQCLIVSHHDNALFPDEMAVNTLHRREDGSLFVEHDPKMRRFDEDEPGIRYIRLVNMMSHADTKMRLAPGVTGLAGLNDIGKSVFTRGLRAVAYGEVSDADIRHGEKSLEVEIGIENGLVVCFSRQKKRNPVNLWSIRLANGEIYEHDGTRYEAGGRTPPEWLDEFLNMPRIEGLDLHLSHQKFPVFLLGEAPSTRAGVLSIGREAGYIQNMIARHKAWVSEDNGTVRNGEKELSAVLEQLKGLEGLEGLKEQENALSAALEAIQERLSALGRLGHRIAQIEAEAARAKTAAEMCETFKGIPALPDLVATARLRELVSGLEQSGAFCARAETEAEALASLPAEPQADFQSQKRLGQAIEEIARRVEQREAASRVQSVMAELPQAPEIKDTNAILALGKQLRAAEIERERVEAVVSALSTEVKEPDVHNTAGLQQRLNEIAGAMARVEAGEEAKRKLDEEFAQVKAEVEALVEEAGGECPVCGGSLSAAELMRGDHHAA